MACNPRFDEKTGPTPNGGARIIFRPMTGVFVMHDDGLAAGPDFRLSVGFAL